MPWDTFTFYTSILYSRTTLLQQYEKEPTTQWTSMNEKIIYARVQ